MPEPFNMHMLNDKEDPRYRSTMIDDGSLDKDFDSSIKDPDLAAMENPYYDRRGLYSSSAIKGVA